MWTLPHFCWGVWKERNNHIFRDREVPVNVLLDKINGYLRENFLIRKVGLSNKGGMYKDREEDKRTKR